MMRLLAISGSLRQASSNTILLRAVSQLAPEGMEIALYEGLGDLPHFNPDLEEANLPAVQDLKERVREADGILICSPEYAHGVPGSLKNALDWLVSGEEFIGKPVALLNASPVSTYAHASLAETVTVMSGHLDREASITVPLRGKKFTEADLIADAEIAGVLRTALVTFSRTIESRRGVLTW